MKVEERVDFDHQPLGCEWKEEEVGGEEEQQEDKRK